MFVQVLGRGLLRSEVLGKKQDYANEAWNIKPGTPVTIWTSPFISVQSLFIPGRQERILDALSRKMGQKMTLGVLLEETGGRGLSITKISPAMTYLPRLGAFSYIWKMWSSRQITADGGLFLQPKSC
ncbi:hypothetical protein GH714_015852 [Hevea brasiliensis]|uniref:Uncharacterized protein n=1 Tax=Hevea brasiliensis TaxID=3981 RepID=A0A6A6LXP1_HEVBR|nr:hypothetical protein GH714_015852 [Hevea brasiliensis]